jgi:hypothetical protein
MAEARGNAAAGKADRVSVSSCVKGSAYGALINHGAAGEETALWDHGEHAIALSAAIAVTISTPAHAQRRLRLTFVQQARRAAAFWHRRLAFPGSARCHAPLSRPPGLPPI